MALPEAFAKPAQSKLSVEHIHMVFSHDGKTTPVLNDVNLEVSEGEFLCIVGPSGCGKSTLLSMIAGFLSPSSGAVRIDGEAVARPDPRRIFVFQEPESFPGSRSKATSSSVCSTCRGWNARAGSRFSAPASWPVPSSLPSRKACRAKTQIRFIWYVVPSNRFPPWRSSAGKYFLTRACRRQVKCPARRVTVRAMPTVRRMVDPSCLAAPR